MKKPSTELTFEKIIETAFNKKVAQLLSHICRINDIKQFENASLKISYEKVKNYSLPIRTYRYKNELWLRAYKKGLAPADGYCFESPFIK